MYYFYIILTLYLTCCKASCPAGSLQGPTSDRCYKFIGIAKPWLGAQSDCSTAGGNLTSVNNAYENLFLASNAAQIFGNNEFVWLGGSKLMVPGQWSWNDAHTFVYTNWDKGQPVNTSGNDCLGLNIQIGTWSAISCSLSASYICEVPSSSDSGHTCPVSPTQPANKCPDGWHYFDYTNQCYYVGNTADWETARLYCMNLQSNLTSIHSYTENGFVADISNPVTNFVWIGLNKLNGDWEWIDGTPTDFIDWHENQPDNSGNCGHMGNCGHDNRDCDDYKEQWDDFNCAGIGKFVCKKAPSSF